MRSMTDKTNKLLLELIETSEGMVGSSISCGPEDVSSVKALEGRGLIEVLPGRSELGHFEVALRPYLFDVARAEVERLARLHDDGSHLVVPECIHRLISISIERCREASSTQSFALLALPLLERCIEKAKSR